MAVSIMSIIGLCIAGAATALATGYENGQDYYECIQTSRVTMLRLEEMLRNSLLVTDANNIGGLWVWREDTNGDKEMNMSEISIISHNRAANQLVEKRVVFPNNWSEWVVRLHNSPLEPYQMTEAYTWQVFYFRNSYIVETVLAENVTDFDVTLSPAAPFTRTVGIRMMVSQGSRQLTVHSAVSLRADQTDRVAWVPADQHNPGHWILTD